MHDCRTWRKVAADGVAVDVPKQHFCTRVYGLELGFLARVQDSGLRTLVPSVKYVRPCAQCTHENPSRAKDAKLEMPLDPKPLTPPWLSVWASARTSQEPVLRRSQT